MADDGRAAAIAPNNFATRDKPRGLDALRAIMGGRKAVNAAPAPSAADAAAQLIDEADRARDARDWPRAAENYSRALTIAPRNFAIWVQAGHAEKECGRFDQALRCYRSAEEIEAGDADLQLQIGHLFNRMGRPEQAADQYRRALAIKDEFADAAAALRDIEARMSDAASLLRDRADAARDKGDWRAAAAFYRRYLEAEPKDFPIWVQSGHAEKECGRFKEALECYQTARALNPSDADLHLQIGHIHKMTRRLVEAAASYRKALALDANSDAARELAELGVTVPAAQDEAVSPAPPEAPPPASISPAPVAQFEIAAGDLQSDESLARLAAAARLDRDLLKAAVIERYRVASEPMNASRWRDLAQAFDDLDRKADAARCRQIGEALPRQETAR